MSVGSFSRTAAGNRAYPGGLYSEGRFNGGFFLRYGFWGLIFGGAYTWRGLFSEIYGIINAAF